LKIEVHPKPEVKGPDYHAEGDEKIVKFLEFGRSSEGKKDSPFRK
jgi:hypothetical protein